MARPIYGRWIFRNYFSLVFCQVAKCANAQTPQQKLFTLAHPFPRATVGNDQLKGFLYAVHKRTYPLY